jgi:hypothetical protein
LEIAMADSTMLRLIRRPLVCVLAVSCCSLSMADEYSGKSTGTAPRYTFSWRIEGDALQPRGGTTKGAPVVLDTEPSAAWKALQETGIDDRERDRRAILAMAGTYRATFDFLEVVPFTAVAKPNAPYQSWGTEKVYVDTNRDDAVSLVHILEMRVVQKDGTVTEPMVTKHWRQDWQYQPTHVVEYRGRDRWERRKLANSESKGNWSQTVYQVDESPRYASVGRWQHSASMSTWISSDTWRPLPRREWSVRDDYQVLLGTNRHTIGPAGWVQEENNLKTVLDAERRIDAAKPYVAREYGLARYERLRDADFAAADHYYDRTRGFWDQVRDTWSEVFAKQGNVTLKGPVDKLGLFQPLFARADEIEEKGTSSSGDDAGIIRDALKAMDAIK